MKFKIESRSGVINQLAVPDSVAGFICHAVDTDEIVELPDDIETILYALASPGRFELIPPGVDTSARDVAFPDSHPELWTVYYQNDYD